MHSPIRHPALGLAALLLAVAAPVRGAEECPAAPPAAVSLLILANADKVHEFARSVRDSSAVVRDAATLVFDDGRVVTADVEGAGRHLNELGWAARPIRVVSSLPPRAARPRRSFG